MTLSELLKKIKSARGYENLKEVLGDDLGLLIYSLVNEAEKADRELDIVHDCLTNLYSLVDENVKPINNCLNRIQKLNKKT